MCALGDIVRIFCPQTGYPKYYLCIKAPQDPEAACFIFLNSNPNFQEVFAVDCSQVPFLPVSKTGKTVFSFSMIPKYNRRQLGLYKSKKLGQLDKRLAADLLKHARQLTVLTKEEKALVIAALSKISA